jgi:XPG domain containing
MGIPKLIQTLQPFATRVVLGNNDSGQQGSENAASSNHAFSRVESVVVDGPSLVYHIYHRLLSIKFYKHHFETPHTLTDSCLSQTSPFISIPTYSEVNEAVLAFINRLQFCHGISIQKIYFDGALPTSKRDVRLARLEDGRRKLVGLRQLGDGLLFGGLHARSVCHLVSPSSNKDKPKAEGKSSPVDMKNIDSEALFRFSAPLPAIFKMIPAPPFLVPAAIEYLRSHFDHPLSKASSTSQPEPHKASNPQPSCCGSSVVETVPAEADPYCAAYVKQTNNSTTILTSDSDLLAYDLGNEGSVIFLNSLELCTPPEAHAGAETKAGQTLLGMGYHASSLTSKMGLPCTLQRFCFQRYLDPAMSTSEVSNHCRRDLVSITKEACKLFQQRYSTDAIILQEGNKEIDGDRNTAYGEIARKISRSQFESLDPRVAELVVQFQRLNIRLNKAGRKENEDEGEDGATVLHMYLPLLFEDPSRDSAWSYGCSFRHLAYRLLFQHLLAFPLTTEKIPRLGIKEYQRRGPRIVGLPINLDSETLSREMNVQLQSLLLSYHSHQQHSPPPPTIIAADPPLASASSASHLWKSLALSVVSDQRILDGKSRPDNAWVERYLAAKPVRYMPTSWNEVHNQASVEGVLYSLRILKQVALLVVGISMAVKGWEKEENLSQLVTILRRLPPIGEFIGFDDIAAHEIMDLSKCSNQGMDLNTPPRRIGADKKEQTVRTTEDLLSGSRKRAERRDTRNACAQRKTESKTSKRRRTTGENMFAALENVSE